MRYDLHGTIVARLEASADLLDEHSPAVAVDWGWEGYDPHHGRLAH